MSLMKKTRVASGLRQCSRTVPAREVNLLPRQRLTVDGLSEQQELVSSEACHERPEGVHYSIWICPIRPYDHLEGLSPNNDQGALGQILCLTGKSIVIGGLAVPESSPVI